MTGSGQAFVSFLSSPLSPPTLLIINHPRLRIHLVFFLFPLYFFFAAFFPAEPSRHLPHPPLHIPQTTHSLLGRPPRPPHLHPNPPAQFFNTFSSSLYYHDLRLIGSFFYFTPHPPHFPPSQVTSFLPPPTTFYLICVFPRLPRVPALM